MHFDPNFFVEDGGKNFNAASKMEKTTHYYMNIRAATYHQTHSKRVIRFYALDEWITVVIIE